MMSAPSVILITGCSSGIGRAAAEHLAGLGHTVRTQFAETVGAHLASMPEAADTDDASRAYAAFNAYVASGTRSAYEKGPMARMAGEPIDVARTIARAIAAPRPRARYTVTPSATFFLTLRRWLGDAGWDWFLRSNFAQPGPR